MGRLGVDRAELKTFIDRVNDAFPLERVILFGSRARGDELAESDYDLILVSPDFEGFLFTERMRRVADVWTLPQDADLLCYTPEEFQRKAEGLTMIRKAVEEGEVIYPGGG